MHCSYAKYISYYFFTICLFWNCCAIFVDESRIVYISLLLLTDESIFLLKRIRFKYQITIFFVCSGKRKYFSVHFFFSLSSFQILKRISLQSRVSNNVSLKNDISTAFNSVQSSEEKKIIRTFRFEC